MSDHDRLTKLENYFKMRGDRIEDIEQSIEDLESNIDTLHNLAIRLVKDIDEIKKNESTNKKLEETVTRLIADIQNELNDKSISPNKQRTFPSIYDSEFGDVVLSMAVYPVQLKGVYENHDYTVIVGLVLNNRTSVEQ